MTKTIFFKTFIAFVIASIIFMSITFIILFIGFNNSMNTWQDDRISSIKNEIDTLLKEIYNSNDFITERYLQENIHFNMMGNSKLTIYDKNKNIIFNLKRPGQGPGNRRNLNQKNYLEKIKYYPIKKNNNVAAYYSISFPKFKEEESNTRFLKSMQNTLIISFFLSFIISSIFAFVFSKFLSKETKIVSDGIKEIANGNKKIILNEKGTAEIAEIAKSTNILSKKLIHEEELRTQWAEDIAHDLRTPTTALKTQLEGMMDGVLNFSKERISKNLKEIARLETLINDLAEITKLESPEIKLNKKPVFLANLVNEITHSFNSIIYNKKIKLIINNKCKEVNADEKLLHRAISNIVNNAIKYTKKSGIVKINIYNEINIDRENSIVIEVYNSDSYISEKEQKAVFARLYRGEYSRNTEGTGLGLTITKKIIELHNGNIILKSNKKDGTTFKIILPLNI